MFGRQKDTAEPKAAVQKAEAREGEKENKSWGEKFIPFFVIPQRVILAIMAFFAIVNAYTMRISISMVITQLVVPRDSAKKQPDGAEQVCPREDTWKKPIKGGNYEWSEKLQGFIMSSFYIGYLITHVPGGILADKVGGKYVLMLGILSTCFFTFITPACIVAGGSTALIILRILMGLGEGTTFPALSVLIAHWVPETERAKLGALILGGGQVGSIVCNSVSGIMLDKMAWPWVFYVFGGIALLWCLLFTLLCYSDPTKHPCIKKSELDYLLQELGSVEHNKNKAPIPWKAIVKSVPMYALISAQIGHDWGFYIMVSYLPKYMSDVLQFSIKSNGFYSSCPYISMWICSILSGFIADWLIQKHYMNTTNVRKMMTAIAAFGPAIFMVAASYAGCNKVLVVILFTICMGLMGGYYAGMKLTPLDMSPNYAGTLMAITNGIGSATGVAAPSIAGLMTPDATLLQWRMVFWVAFLVLSLTAVVYCIWASGEVQPFNDPEPKQT